jgi:hypothetical protein
MDGAFPTQTDDYGRGGGSIGGRTGFRGTAENAKTKLCNRWVARRIAFILRRHLGLEFAHGARISASGGFKEIADLEIGATSRMESMSCGKVSIKMMEAEEVVEGDMRPGVDMDMELLGVVHLGGDTEEAE